MLPEEDLKIEQPCEGCYFLRHNQCTLGRFEHFAANGGLVVQDKETGSPTIQGRFCLAKRNAAWASDLNKENVEVVLRAEILVRAEVFVYVDEYHHEDISKTIESLKRQILKPSLVVVICNCTPRSSKLIKLLDDSKLKYRIDVVKDKPSINSCIDIAASKCKGQFYQVLFDGQELERDWLACLDEAINVKMKRILYVKPDVGQGECVDIKVHKQFGGNEPCEYWPDGHDCPHVMLNDLSEKIHYFTKRQNKPYYITTVNEVLEAGR